MLRPERMSKVSVTGSKRVMDDVIDAVHDLRLLHLTDYDNSWSGFTTGDPIEGAEAASDKLVTVRSLESILDVDDEDAGPTRIVTDQAIEEELEGLRHRVNELEDRRDELRSELRDVNERLDTVEPFARLGIDLDLLSGYRTIDVAVGRGRPDEIRAALDASDRVDEYRLESDGDVVAVFARTRGADGSDDAARESDTLADALVAADFAAIGVPDAEGSPEEYRQELEHRRQQLRSKLDNVEGDLEEVKLDAAGFLLAAEEKLSIDVQKTEAPLSFATTENAFVAEGWIPTDREEELRSALDDAVGDRVEFEIVERAAFGSGGEVQVREDVPHEPSPDSASLDDEEDEDETEEEEPQRAVADGSGGNVVMRNDDPPVVQDNPGITSPFEVLVKAVGHPNYREFDPTVILFLTFPAFFGFMIGDFGYGVVYTLIGYYFYSQFDSQAFKSLGGVTITAGLFTMLFGVLYGEIFGLHELGQWIWVDGFGLSHPPIEKGLSPATAEWAQAWFLITALAGILHLNIGYVFQFIEDMEFHGVVDAMEESGSWLLALNGVWLFIFSRLWADSKPAFLFEVLNGGESAAVGLGFAGFPAWAGWAGLLMVGAGFVLLAVGPTVELVEFHTILVHVLSYLRIAAVLLAKAGMAFAVNLLVFGAYVDDKGGWHFGLGGMPQGTGVEYHGYQVSEILFGGLFHGGIAAVVLGLFVLVVGHLVVLILGVTSSGIQAARLEYFEFFSKFYEGNGRAYNPFGYDRKYTTED